MKGRAPGKTTGKAIKVLRPDGSNWQQIGFQDGSGGCGAAMRTACIGLAFPFPSQLEALVGVSIEAGRITHHHPTGFLGGLTASLFTAYACQGLEPRSWGARLLQVIDSVAIPYLRTAREAERNLAALDFFVGAWRSYVKLRGIEDGKSEPRFPGEYGVVERDNFYREISSRGWGGELSKLCNSFTRCCAGASGHDSVLIAYDALLGCKGSWSELCYRSCLHGGDSDTTGSIAGAWFGALYGFQGVPRCNYASSEFFGEASKLAVRCGVVWRCTEA